MYALKYIYIYTHIILYIVISILCKYIILKSKFTYNGWDNFIYLFYNYVIVIYNDI